MDITQYLQEKSELIETRLDKLIPEKDLPHSQLYQAARYSLLGGGKRIRPILALATAETFGGSIEQALSPACTLEMIHTYSLIHDDLPCMDDDDFRRGKPSLHKVFTEGHAVLTGDFLLTYAFEILATDPNLTAEQKVSLIALLAKQAGGNGMVGGQILDIASEGKEISLEDLSQIHQAKTGALIIASLQFGGIIAKASASQLDLLQTFGEQIGHAFQIIDDVLDYTESETKHGKKIASDVVNKKTTYVSLLGVEQSQAKADSLFNLALQTLSKLPFDTSLLEALAKFIVKRKR